MIQLSSFLLFAFFFFSASLARSLFKRLLRPSISYLPGPKLGPWLVGNLPDILRSEPANLRERLWTEEHGSAMCIKGVFGIDVLFLSDPKALQYVLNTSGYTFRRPQQSKATSRLLNGEGILFVEGNEHARQRRIMMPSFHYGTLRNFTPIFRGAATRTTKKWNEIITKAEGPTVIEITNWLSRTTLDALGEAAFDYRFGALENVDNELSKVYRNLIPDTFYKRSDFLIVFEALWGYFPLGLVKILQDFLPTKQLTRFRSYMKVARRVAKRIVDTQSDAYFQGLEGGKDVMSILVRANMSEDPRTKLDTDTIMAQMTTFMFAGHDTTSATLSWALYELARHPEYQDKLREEIRDTKKHAMNRGDSELTVADLDSMKYLTALMKETLRFHPIVPILQREPVKDTVIPLSNPVKSKTGDMITTIPVGEGQRIFISLSTYNRLESVWGKDANEWRPERFLEDISAKSKTGFGVISNIGTFGSGLRSCIGWRFAMVEMQTLLIEFVENFKFLPTDATKEVTPGPSAIISPMLKTEPGRIQLPLLVSTAQDKE